MTSLDSLVLKDDAYIAGLAGSAVALLPASMRGIPIQEVLDTLMEQRAQLPDKHPDLTRLDSSIISILMIVRSLSNFDAFSAGPYQLGLDDTRRTSMPGESMLQDLKEANLKLELSDLLEVQYLSTATEDGICWPLRGLLFGPCKRPIVCVPTRLRNKALKNVFYLVDTGAPKTELSPHAFLELGSESTPGAAHAVINGFNCQVRLCDPTGNHPDIPVLGADYMFTAGIILTINYKDQTFTLDRAT